MNILFITAGSGPDTTIGGSLIRTVEIARRLKKRNTISILTTTGGKIAIKKYFPPKEIVEIKTPTSDFSTNRFFLFQLAITYLQIILQSFLLLNRLPPHADLIYLDSDGVWDIFPAIVYKRRYPKTKLISMNHHMISLSTKTLFSFIGSFINILLQKMGRFFIRRFADGIFILNTDSGNIIRDEYINEHYTGKIFLVDNGLDIKAINGIKNPKQKRYDACFFGFLRPSKGLYDIVPIWKRVVSVHPNASLIIIGGMLPQYKTDLMHQIKKYKLTHNIFFTDYIIDKNRAIETVKQAHIFISPSHEEGWGIASMECLAAGLPGVVWDLKTYRRILRSGVIKIKRFQINDFAKAVIKLLNEFKIQTYRPLSYLKKFDWDIIAEEDFKHFKKIVAS
jgi:glycosyltransferase involved in cell wall biosynthesis